MSKILCDVRRGRHILKTHPLPFHGYPPLPRFDAGQARWFGRVSIATALTPTTSRAKTSPIYSVNIPTHTNIMTVNIVNV